MAAVGAIVVVEGMFDSTNASGLPARASGGARLDMSASIDALGWIHP
jgi:hypothetical protein